MIWFTCDSLSNRPLVPPMCISELGQHWFRRLVAYSAPSHYLNHCWVIVNWTLRNKHQWNLNQNTKLFIHQNASENIVCETAAILSSGRWVNMIGCEKLSSWLPPVMIKRGQLDLTVSGIGVWNKPFFSLASVIDLMPGGHEWEHYYGVLSLYQVPKAHLKTRHP